MALTASIIVPTRERAGYLDVALASIAPQAAAAGAELLVVDDGPDPATRATAERHGARYVAHDATRGLNAARNTGIDAARGELLVFVDDDVEARPGWLDALLHAEQRAEPDVGVLTGPIHARFDDHPFRSCGREGPPITSQHHGAQDRDVAHAWGANMTLRRSALERAGRFDETRELYGDEQEWQSRLHAAGGRVRYVAAAALDHRRAGDDA
ncbi:MAG TPA: glycosyltransferase, partial [Solirubrobacteraceae bacterium]